MSDSTAKQNISERDCQDYLATKVFRLQPKDYGNDHPNWPGLVGLEVEMLPLSKSPNSKIPQPVPLYNGKPNLASPLLRLAASEAEWASEVIPGPDGGDSRLFRIHLEEQDQISFEPGGQLEISTAPYPCLTDAVDRMKNLQAKVDKELALDGIKIRQVGINPWHSVPELGLQMEKSRYAAMDEYFRRIGEFGPRMMRQTCTIQVNLDFGPTEEELADRFLASQLISPIATAIFANSPFVDNKLSTHKSFRSHIWQNTDPHRTGFPDIAPLLKNRDKATAAKVYGDKVLDTPVVFIKELNYKIPGSTFTFRQWIKDGMDGVFPTIDDFTLHLSLFFPEVRARGFIELRSIDAQSRTWQVVPAAFLTGIFYNREALDKTLEILRPHALDIHDLWKRSSHGLDDPLISELARKLCQVSIDGFDGLPSCFRESCSIAEITTFYEHFTNSKRTPADDLIDMAKQTDGVTEDTFDRLENMWNKLIC